jgi:hypothetical protein
LTPAVARDSKLVKPEARRVENAEAEGEAEPEIGLALMEDNTDPSPQAIIESDPGELIALPSLTPMRTLH